MPRKTPKKRPLWKKSLFVAGLLCSIVLITWVAYLDIQVRSKFDGKKWSIPARVYGRSLEVYEGLPLSSRAFEQELSALGYQFVKRVSQPGQVAKQGHRYHVYTRGFTFWDKVDSAQKYTITLNNGQVSHLKTSDPSQLLMRFEPQEIGSIYPAHGEDRVLLRLADIPALLGETLIAVEDRDFLRHHGISVKGIARAMLANIRAGGMVQGGSTLTQQLVKNFYLNQRRSLWRKIQEAFMSVLLEWRYEKSDILEAYLNEVYLGQNGPRGIHGFGLASQHYFNQPIKSLKTHQIALLIGVVKGASYYNPWKHPERAQARRDLVLQIMASHQLISADAFKKAKAKPLDIIENNQRRLGDYPAFLDLVKRQLREDYRDEDLQSEGLRVFTTLAPSVQAEAEKAIAERLKKFSYRKQDTLQAAAVITAVGSGEVLAIVGGRDPRFSGFNRALDAERPIGSLIKPAVYLSALNQPERYQLTSLLDDSPVTIDLPNGTQWQPRNFSRSSHGDVLLYQSLARSYNQSTARLGMDVGIDNVASTLSLLGLKKSVPLLPSLLLGATPLSPFEVSHLYHTLAADGIYTPLRSIRSVLDAHGVPLQRYPLVSEPRISAQQIHLMHYALQATMRTGTGAKAYTILPGDLIVAGKTGTTNKQRDSWFAGYSGDHLGVVWIGRDDNGPTPLTGSSGALLVWADIFKQLSTRSVAHNPPEDIQYFWVDGHSGLRSHERCEGAQLVPYVKGTEPQETAACDWLDNPIKHWLRKWF